MRQTNVRYRGNQQQFSDSSLAPSTGGDILVMQASVALLVGDAIQITALQDAQVTKLTTNPTRVLGIVVGGNSIPDKNIYEASGATENTSTIIGQAAAAANGQVLVLVRGTAYVVADGAIAVGALLKISATTAGQVTAATADTDGGAIIGKLIANATTNAGDIGLAYIYQG